MMLLCYWILTIVELCLDMSYLRVVLIKATGPEVLSSSPFPTAEQDQRDMTTLDLRKDSPHPRCHVTSGVRTGLFG